MKVIEESRRMIKPLITDGDNHNDILPLSSADLGVHQIYVPVIYAFNAPSPPTEVMEQGLANVLVLYRAWAGRLITQQDGRPAIHLNDEGVVLIEAIADGTLADAVPFDLHMHLTPPTLKGVPELLFIQLTRFTCGGLVIGIARHHSVSDGEAATAFMNSWGKIVRGEPIHPLPIHDRSLLMARDPPNPSSDHGDVYNRRTTQPQTQPAGDVAARRLHFSVEFLKRLRTSASCSADQDKRLCTRFESLLAHLWRCISKARGLHGEVTTRAKFSVNGRKRLNPPLPSEYFGNVLYVTCAESTVKGLVERPLHHTVNLIHNAITRVDNDCMRSAMDFFEVRRLDNNNEPQPISINPFCADVRATSWLSFPLYELDFGWGNPFYIGPPLDFITERGEGLLIFVPSNAKDGSIDVFIGLIEPHMATFEQICYTIEG